MSWIADHFLKFSLGLLLVFAFLIRGDLFATNEHPGQDEHVETEASHEVVKTAMTKPETEVVATNHAVDAPAETPLRDAVVSVAEPEKVLGIAPKKAADAAPAVENAYSVTEYWIAARTAFWIGDLKTAEQEYLNILSREPNNWQAHTELGNLYARSHRYDKATAEYQQASLILNAAGMYTQSRQLAVIMAELYPAWKDKAVSGLKP